MTPIQEKRKSFFVASLIFLCVLIIILLGRGKDDEGVYRFGSNSKDLTLEQKELIFSEFSTIKQKEIDPGQKETILENFSGEGGNGLNDLGKQEIFQYFSN